MSTDAHGEQRHRELEALPLIATAEVLHQWAHEQRNQKRAAEGPDESEA